jgi:hypothetical protein
VEKIFSVRLGEAALDELERVSRRLNMTKKKFLEQAIHMCAQQLGQRDSEDIWSETLGAWNRRERAETTIRRSRAAFRRSFQRHHRGRGARLRR